MKKSEVNEVSQLYIDPQYRPELSLRETERAIKMIKDFFQDRLVVVRRNVFSRWPSGSEWCWPITDLSRARDYIRI